MVYTSRRHMLLVAVFVSLLLCCGTMKQAIQGVVVLGRCGKSINDTMYFHML